MWVILGLISAVTDASKNVFIKWSINQFDPLVVAWALVTLSLAVFLPVMFVRGVPELGSIFWWTFAVRIIVDTLATILYVRAIKESELSLSLPMLTLTPLFLLLINLVAQLEMPAPPSFVGVFLIVIGSYVLNYKKEKDLLRPFRAIFQDTGVKKMLIVAFLYAVTSTLHTIAIQHSNPYFYAGLSAIAFVIVFTPLAYTSNRQNFRQAIRPENLVRLAPMGLLDGVAILAQMIGQSLSLTVLVVSLKRTSVLFSAMLGWIFFKEKINDRVLPIALMILGAILIISFR